MGCIENLVRYDVTKDIQDHLEKNVIIDANDCWIWQLSTLVPPKLPYGQVKYNGKQYRVHNLMYRLIYGEIPKGLNVLHECDVPQCCNPKHLFLGTVMDNSIDMMSKGRAACGEKNANTYLLEAQVINLLQRHADGARIEHLAEEYKMSPNTLKAILYGQSWSYLPRPVPRDVVW